MLRSLKRRRKPPLDVPTYRQGNLAMRPLQEQDASALYAIVARDRAYLRQYQNWPDTISNYNDMLDLVRLSHAKTRGQQGYDLLITYKGQPAGKIGLVLIDWQERRGEIGYWLGQRFQGHGLVSRAAWIVTGHAITQLKLDCVQIRCAGANVRSRAIPERLGYHFDQLIPNKLWIHGEQHDDTIYSMTTSQWYKRMIYHITNREDWEAAQKRGSYLHETLAKQGFIHASRRDQVVKVANAVYAGQDDLVLLCIDPMQVPAKYEPPDPTVPADHAEQETFPHIYGDVPLNAVLKVVKFQAKADGTFELPPTLT